MLYNCSQIELQPYTIHSRQKCKRKSVVHGINESGIPHHKSSSSSPLCTCELCEIACKAQGWMTGREIGRHASSAGGNELLDARALFREEVFKDRSMSRRYTKHQQMPHYIPLPAARRRSPPCPRRSPTRGSRRQARPAAAQRAGVVRRRARAGAAACPRSAPARSAADCH